VLRQRTVILIQVGFEPHALEKPLLGQMISDIRAKLAGHDMYSLKIVSKKTPFKGEVVPTFHGDPDSIEKAKRVLGIY
jgi:hypothetical protein